MIVKKHFFNFYGYIVEIETDWAEISSRLCKDFSYFKISTEDSVQLSIQIKQAPLSLKEPGARYCYVNEKVSFYNKGKSRYCNYHEKVETLGDFNINKFIVQGEDLHGVHEVSYLLTLSRVGKALDINGFHRLHSVGFIFEETLFLGLFSSGVGKTTMLSHIMQKVGFSMISDDSPLIRNDGGVSPFPIRLGFNKDGYIPNFFKDKKGYELERFRYGTKKLYSLEELNYSIGGTYKKIVLLSGHQGSGAEVKSSLGLSHAIHIFREGVVGVGLPILFEYFWESGFEDFITKLKIATMRTLAFTKLWIKAKKYKITLSSDHDKNYELIKELAKK